MAEKERVIGFLLRLPAGLHARLQAMAARERRSLHAQIIYVLERAVEADEGKAAA